jgi:hypothetical protein
MASDPDVLCIRAVRFVDGPGNVRFPLQNVFPRRNSLSGGPAAGVGGVAAAGKDSMLPCRGWPKGVLNFDQPTKRQRMADVIEDTTATGSDTATAGKDTTAAGMDTAAGKDTTAQRPTKRQRMAAVLEDTIAAGSDSDSDGDHVSRSHPKIALRISGICPKGLS